MDRRRCGPLKPVPRPEPRPQAAQAPLVYTVAEVAELLKVSPGTVRNMIEQGQLYAIRLHARRIVIPKWAVDELVARPRPDVPFPRPASSA